MITRPDRYCDQCYFVMSQKMIEQFKFDMKCECGQSKISDFKQVMVRPFDIVQLHIVKN